MAAARVFAAVVPPADPVEPVVPAAGVAGPVETVAAVTAPVPADAISVPVLERLAGLVWLRRPAPRPEVKLGIPFSVIAEPLVFEPVDEEPVPVAGGSVIGSDPVLFETALTGAVGVIGGMAVGVTAGVAEIDAGATENDPEAADEVLEGSAAGTALVVSPEVQPRPWQTVLVDPLVELPVAPGRPLTFGVAAASEVVEVSEVVDVVEVVEVVDVVLVGVEVVVVPVVVVPVGVVLAVPVAPAPASVVVPVEVVVVGVVVVWAGVADCGVVSVLGVLAGVALAADVVAGVAGCTG